MRLSIIIPVYCVEDTLNRCIESVLGQNMSDMEVILVDDGSPDLCPQMCDEWAQHDKRIQVVHKENGGLSDARNAGIELAHGDYLTFVDSDDFLAPNTYLPLMAFLEQHMDIDLLEYPLDWHFGASNQRRISFGHKIYNDPYDYWRLTQAYKHTYAWNKIYRRSLFTGIRYPVGRVFEDIYVLHLLLKNANRIATTEQGLYHYCLNPKGITNTATGRELSMLLDHHLAVMSDPRMIHLPLYYMHVLNIQMDVCEQNNEQPRLPSLHISPLTKGMTIKHRLKAIALNILGIKKLCKLNKIQLRLRRSRS